MSTALNHRKSNILFIVLGCFFVTNALLAEFIGVKLFSLEAVLGLLPANISLFGIDNLSFSLTAGVLLWPVVFIMTDIINEYFGLKGVRLLSFIAAGLIVYAFIMVYFAMWLEPAGFWIEREIDGETINMPAAFNAVFGQGLWIISGSLMAFLIGQIIDVRIFHVVKKITGEKLVWLRATGSTLVSQLIDSFVVLFIAFYLGPTGWSLEQVLAIGIVNYMYKFTVAVVLTPAIYLGHFLIDAYLGKDLAAQLKEQASK